MKNFVCKINGVLRIGLKNKKEGVKMDLDIAKEMIVLLGDCVNIERTIAKIKDEDVKKVLDNLLAEKIELIKELSIDLH